jgi:uncharacterized membrane protein
MEIAELQVAYTSDYRRNSYRIVTSKQRKAVIRRFAFVLLHLIIFNRYFNLKYFIYLLLTLYFKFVAIRNVKVPAPVVALSYAHLVMDRKTLGS